MSITVKPFYINDETGEEFPYLEEIGSVECRDIVGILQHHLGNVYVSVYNSHKFGQFDIHMEPTDENLNKIKNIYEGYLNDFIYPELYKKDLHIRYEIISFTKDKFE